MHRWIVGIVARASLTIAVLLLVYYLMPARSQTDWLWLLLGIGAFSAVVAVQVPAILRSAHPGGRAIESLALIVPLFLLLFSRIYLSRSLADPAAFSEPLDHNTALYFTVTVFATVGFGDITPVATTERMVVTVQMLLNLVVLGAVIRLIAQAAQRGMRRRGTRPLIEGDPAGP